jgi:hypothetical protein
MIPIELLYVALVVADHIECGVDATLTLTRERMRLDPVLVRCPCTSTCIHTHVVLSASRVNVCKIIKRATEECRV